MPVVPIGNYKNQANGQVKFCVCVIVPPSTAVAYRPVRQLADTDHTVAVVIRTCALPALHDVSPANSSFTECIISLTNDRISMKLCTAAVSIGRLPSAVPLVSELNRTKCGPDKILEFY